MSLGPTLAGKILLVKQKGATVKANSTGVGYNWAENGICSI